MKLARLRDGPEIFFSLQGEGKNLGTPSVFVRTSRCNLYCTWCDTPYTWNWRGSSFVHTDALKYDPDAASIELDSVAVAERVARWSCRRVVFTGGEPMLQAGDCARVMRELLSADLTYAFEIETNGTLLPPDELDQLVEQYTVSPKLESSAVDRSLRLRHDCLARFASDQKSVFKFVVASDACIREVDAIAADHGIRSDRIYLMPEGTSAEKLARSRAFVAQACLARGYRFSDRLHIHLFGNGPGV
jgi:organic radical activating enzyme